MVVANAVVVRNGYLYVSDTTMVPDSKPLVSGVYRFKLDEEGVEMKRPLIEDPHLIGTMETYNPKVGFGADGMAFDSKGNLYVGNFADGTLHKIAFDDQGHPKPMVLFAKAPFMKSCDGIFCDLKTDKIYVADSLANAVQVVLPDGTVCTLAQDPENDGTTGLMDQPSEVLIRGKELVVANFDFPVPGGVNTKFEMPNTLSRIPLE
jgi:sugar lactone lactonase YvrE